MDLIIIGILALFMIEGWRRGILRIFEPAASYILAIAFNQPVSLLLARICGTYIEKTLQESFQMLKITEYDLYKDAPVLFQSAADTVSAGFSSIMQALIIRILAAALIIIGVRIIFWFIGGVEKLPFINGMSRFAGAALSGGMGLTLIWVTGYAIRLLAQMNISAAQVMYEILDRGHLMHWILQFPK